MCVIHCNYIYSLLFDRSDSDGALISQTQQHVGAVRTIDCNPFQPSLIASGASESEVFIWDINNPTSPMSPGNKLHPLEDITCVAWNRQVQHILGSTSPSGRSVVWDLRKNEPIIQVSDSSSRVSLSIHLSICLSICLFICLSIYLSIYISVCLSISLA